MDKVKAAELAALARSGFLAGAPYRLYDCQGYIKGLLREFGIVKRWLGTNDMWRNYLTEKHLIYDQTDIPEGALLFSVSFDRKPPPRYPDGPDCYHVGIYIGNGEYWHSTTGGVQHGDYMPRWNYWALLDCVEYQKEGKFMQANRIRYDYKDPDGQEDYEILEMTAPHNITSISFYMDTQSPAAAAMKEEQKNV